jgi:hypothetical protein
MCGEQATVGELAGCIQRGPRQRRGGTPTCPGLRPCACRSYAAIYLATDPHRKSVYRSLMRFYVHAGGHDAVNKLYQRGIAHIVDELGVSLQARTQSVYRQLALR